MPAASRVAPSCLLALTWVVSTCSSTHSPPRPPPRPPSPLAPRPLPPPPGVVGAKANNLAKLRSTLPDWVRVPASVALPFGVFEAVMAHPANAGPAAQLQRLQQELGNAQVGMLAALDAALATRGF